MKSTFLLALMMLMVAGTGCRAPATMRQQDRLRTIPQDACYSTIPANGIGDVEAAVSLAAREQRADDSGTQWSVSHALSSSGDWSARVFRGRDILAAVRATGDAMMDASRTPSAWRVPAPAAAEPASSQSAPRANDRWLFVDLGSADQAILRWLVIRRIGWSAGRLRLEYTVPTSRDYSGEYLRSLVAWHVWVPLDGMPAGPYTLELAELTTGNTRTQPLSIPPG